MISVVMPAYNASKFIAQAIESILNQTFREFELLIIDDGSTDNTVEIVKHYFELDQRVRLIQTTHSGVCHARNIGIDQSRYPWIAVMDADDIALPERFEKQINVLAANPKIVVLGSYAYHISLTEKVLSFQKQGPISEEEFYNLRQDKHIPFVIHPTAVLKKDVLLKVGKYDPQFPVAQDLELISRMSDHGLVLAVPEPLLLYRIHLNSASMTKFFHQQLMAEWAVARHQARIVGRKEPDMDQFIEAQKKIPVLIRLNKRVRILSQFWYRKAGLFIGENRYLQAGFYLSLAIAANPSYSIPRIWKQKFSPEARSSLQKYVAG